MGATYATAEGMDYELEIARGRALVEVETHVVRELAREDLKALDQEKGSKPQRIKRVSERHHALAKFLALGMSAVEASVQTGYSMSHISILQRDPTFINLMTFYRDHETSIFRDGRDRLNTLFLDAASEMQRRLDKRPSSLGNGTLMDIIKTGADRTGLGPSTTNVHVNIGLAQRLENARRRIKDITPQDPPKGGHSEPLLVDEEAA